MGLETESSPTQNPGRSEVNINKATRVFDKLIYASSRRKRGWQHTRVSAEASARASNNELGKLGNAKSPGVNRGFCNLKVLI